MMTAPAASELRRTAHTLGTVARNWLNPDDPVRQEAIPALQVSTGFSRSMIEKALAAAFEELTEAKLLAGELPSPGKAPESILHILAGNVFTAWLPGAVLTLLLGAECGLKPSSREPVFATLWKRSVDAVDPALGGRIHIVRWDTTLPARYGAVVAYGSDETIAVLRQAIASRTRFIAYGHKFSVGVVWREALGPLERPTLLKHLAADIEPFRLQGCLSPQIIYVEGGVPRDLASALAGEMAVMPKLEGFTDWKTLNRILDTYRPRLSSFGYAGPAGRTAAIQRDLDVLGFSRVCRFGEMQQPPWTWRNGGFSLLDALLSS